MEAKRSTKDVMPPPPENSGEVSIHWFRHGLRIHDNPALLDALKDCNQFYPVFIFDGEVAGTKTAGYNRMRFLWECLDDLDESFRKVGGRLFVFRGQPAEIFDKLIDEWGVGKLTFESDPEPIWTERDNSVRELCSRRGVQCKTFVSHTLWDPNEIISNNGGQPPLTFESFNQITSVLGEPPRPVSDPDFTNIDMPVCQNHEQKFGLPSLKDLGCKPECPEQLSRRNEWKGGETKAVELLQVRMEYEEEAYKQDIVLPNQHKPDLLGPPLSMSAHLRFGCLSVRKFYWTIHDTYKKVHPEREQTVALSAQLIWREYFYTMSVNNIMYDKMKDNPICLSIPWYKDEQKLEKWTMGKTGFPWIDAAMNQMRHEGWIHHVARHAVSCFLTRGDLWISWVDGLQVFFKYLLDADWSVCAGNWMWVSSSAFEKVLQCPKCFCPVRYGRRLDPSGEYIRRYVPQLRKMPLRYLFDPWKAPLAEQEKAGCIIGKDYPHPMVEHSKASKDCNFMMNQVRISLRNRVIPHCAPSSSMEVTNFVWLPDHQLGLVNRCDGEHDDTVHL